MSEEPADINANPDQQAPQPAMIESVPGVEPTASAEQASAQPQELIDSVPGVTGEAAPAAPAE